MLDFGRGSYNNGKISRTRRLQVSHRPTKIVLGGKRGGGGYVNSAIMTNVDECGFISFLKMSHGLLASSV